MSTGRWFHIAGQIIRDMENKNRNKQYKTKEPMEADSMLIGLLGCCVIISAIILGILSLF